MLDYYQLRDFYSEIMDILDRNHLYLESLENTQTNLRIRIRIDENLKSYGRRMVLQQFRSYLYNSSYEDRDENGIWIIEADISNMNR